MNKQFFDKFDNLNLILVNQQRLNRLYRIRDSQPCAFTLAETRLLLYSLDLIEENRNDFNDIFNRFNEI